MGLLEIVKDEIISIIRAESGYLKECEKIETQRIATVASIKNFTEIIKANNEVQKLIMENYWEEKQQLREVCEQALDKSIKLADSELAELHISMIELLYEQNPFSIIKI